MKYTIFTWLVGVLAYAPFFVSANVIMTEMMYDLEGSDTNEWIEVQNIGTEDIDLSGWKLFENNVNHTFKIFNGDIILQAGEYAIIANDANAFLNAYLNYQGTVFDSVFSLSNTGETLVMRNELNVDKDSFAYTNALGANGDGTSLQKIDSEWRPGNPTPGSQNSWSQVAGTSTEETSEGEGTTPIPVSKTTTKVLSIYTSPIREFEFEEPVFAVSAGPDRLTAVGNTIEFRADTIEKNLNEQRGADFSWVFGDGSIKYGKSVEYTYYHPGEYIVVVNAEKGEFEAAAQLQVTVFEPDLSVYQSSNGDIHVKNLSSNDMNLYRWKISHLGKDFVFPKNTIIKKNTEVVIQKNNTLFEFVPGLNPLIIDPRGHIYSNRTLIEEENSRQASVIQVNTNHSDDGMTVDNLERKEKIEVVKQEEVGVDNVVVEPVVLGEQDGWWQTIKRLFIALID